MLKQRVGVVFEASRRTMTHHEEALPRSSSINNDGISEKISYNCAPNSHQ